MKPGLGNYPQDVVNKQVGSYNIFLAIMWQRMGTPTQLAESGTEEEFIEALRRKAEFPGLEIWFYFKKFRGSAWTKGDQYRRLKEFKGRLSNQKGVFYWEFGDSREFRESLRQHLENYLLSVHLLPSRPVFSEFSSDTAKSIKSKSRDRVRPFKNLVEQFMASYIRIDRPISESDKEAAFVLLLLCYLIPTLLSIVVWWFVLILEEFSPINVGDLFMLCLFLPVSTISSLIQAIGYAFNLDMTNEVFEIFFSVILSFLEVSKWNAYATNVWHLVLIGLSLLFQLATFFYLSYSSREMLILRRDYFRFLITELVAELSFVQFSQFSALFGVNDGFIEFWEVDPNLVLIMKDNHHLRFTKRKYTRREINHILDSMKSACLKAKEINKAK